MKTYKSAATNAKQSNTSTFLHIYFRCFYFQGVSCNSRHPGPGECEGVSELHFMIPLRDHLAHRKDSQKPALKEHSLTLDLCRGSRRICKCVLEKLSITVAAFVSVQSARAALGNSAAWGTSPRHTIHRNSRSTARADVMLHKSFS